MESSEQRWVPSAEERREEEEGKEVESFSQYFQKLLPSSSTLPISSSLNKSRPSSSFNKEDFLIIDDYNTSFQPSTPPLSENQPQSFQMHSPPNNHSLEYHENLHNIENDLLKENSSTNTLPQQTNLTEQNQPKEDVKEKENLNEDAKENEDLKEKEDLDEDLKEKEDLDEDLKEKEDLDEDLKDEIKEDGERGDEKFVIKPYSVLHHNLKEAMMGKMIEIKMKFKNESEKERFLHLGRIQFMGTIANAPSPENEIASDSVAVLKNESSKMGQRVLIKPISQQQRTNKRFLDITVEKRSNVSGFVLQTRTLDPKSGARLVHVTGSILNEKGVCTKISSIQK